MLHLFKTLDLTRFQLVTKDNITNLKIGDIVMSQTYTYSQKYFNKPGYESFNITNIGILIKKNNEQLPDSYEILQYHSETNNFILSFFFNDPGSSGSYNIYLYV